MTRKRNVKPPLVDRKRCTGCGRCVAACPNRLISLEAEGYRKHAAISSPGRCDDCGRCIEECLVNALSAD